MKPSASDSCVMVTMVVIVLLMTGVLRRIRPPLQESGNVANHRCRLPHSLTEASMPIDVLPQSPTLRQGRQQLSRSPRLQLLFIAPVRRWPAGGSLCRHDSQFRDGNTRPSRSGIPILFPFAGRIRGGSAAITGDEYQLETNDNQGTPFTASPTHAPGESSHKRLRASPASFNASVDDAAILKLWPADFRFAQPTKSAASSFWPAMTSRIPRRWSAAVVVWHAPLLPAFARWRPA